MKNIKLIRYNDITASLVFRYTSLPSESITDRLGYSTYVSDQGIKVSDYRINVTLYPADTITYSSSNNSIATVSGDGYVTYQSSGQVIITVTVNGVPYTKALTLFTQTTQYNTFVGYASGSLAGNIYDRVDGMSRGKDPTISKPLFTTRNFGGPYVRNTSCWRAQLSSQLTCISVYSAHGTLISPRHVYGANHYPPNTTLEFVTTDNQVVRRTVTSTYNPGGDARVSLLDSDVPNTIKFAKVLLSNSATINVTNYMPLGSNLIWNGTTPGVPSLYLDQEDKALIMSVVPYGTSIYGVIPSYDTNFTETAIGGDSGSPWFFVINNELVLTCSFFTPIFGAGPAQYSTLINAWMSGNSPYQMTVVSLTGFLTYTA